MTTARPRLWVVPVVAFVAMELVLCRLGFWQLDRARQKDQRAAAFQSRFQMPTAPLKSLVEQPPADVVWRSATTTVEFDGPVLFVDNRIRYGRAGYEVLALGSGEDSNVFVNVGWVPAGGDRRTLPAARLPAGPTPITGTLAPPPVPGVAWLNTDYAMETFPGSRYRIQYVDFDYLADFFGRELRPQVLNVTSNLPAGFDRTWPQPGNESAKHRAYATQWFAMAAVLAVIAAYLTWRSRSRPQPGRTVDA